MFLRRPSVFDTVVLPHLGLPALTTTVEHALQCIAATKHAYGTEMTVRHLDDASRIICSSFGRANVLASLHPNHQKRQDALDTFLALYRHVQDINTDHGVYSAILHSPPHRQSPHMEYDRVRRALIREFEADGVQFNSTSQRGLICQAQARKRDLQHRFEHGQLDELRQVRHDLALLCGYESFAHQKLTMQVLNTPSRVNAFLDRIAAQTMSGHSNTTHSPNTAGIFSLQTCINGLIHLAHLFGVHLTITHNHLFTDGIAEFLVTSSDDEKTLGHLIIDVWHRDGKTMNEACTFQVETRHPPSTNSALAIISCSWPRRQQQDVGWDCFVQLAHEFGHALHVLLSETEYQNLAGTRGEFDVAEVPSIFMERLVRQEHVLAGFLETRQHVEKIMQHIHHTAPARKRRQRQIVAESMLDLTLACEPHMTVTNAWQQIVRERMGGAPELYLDHRQFALRHASQYASSYYAYVLSDALAGQYQVAGPRALAGELLQYGGARDPNDVFRALVGGEHDIDVTFV